MNFKIESRVILSMGVYELFIHILTECNSRVLHMPTYMVIHYSTFMKAGLKVIHNQFND